MNTSATSSQVWGSAVDAVVVVVGVVVVVVVARVAVVVVLVGVVSLLHDAATIARIAIVIR
jgi:hypothetical protein